MTKAMAVACMFVLFEASAFCETPIRLQVIMGGFASINRSTHETAPVILGGIGVIKPMPQKFFLRGFGAVAAVEPDGKPAFAQLLYGSQLGYTLTSHLSVAGGAGAVTRFRPVGTDTLPTGFFAVNCKVKATSKWSIGFNTLVNSQAIGIGGQLARLW